LLRLWKPNHDIKGRHQRFSPHCNFITAELWHSSEAVSRPALSQSSSVKVLETLQAKPFNDMRYEEKRLSSFQGFPPSCPVQPAELARAGFYFTGRSDAVQCFSCHIALRGWETGDTAEEEHRRHNPFCPLLNNTGTTNVPIETRVIVSSAEAIPTMKFQPLQNAQVDHIRIASFKNWPSSAPVNAEDLAEAGFYYTGQEDVVCCFHCGVKVKQWVPGDIAIDEHIRHSPDCSYARQVAQRKQHYESYTTPNAEATAEAMKSYEKRLMSFKDWPATAPVSAESLAMAGFYYSGSGDGVRCFTCHGALKGWQPGDTAWEEHAKYFPSCEFVQQHDPTIPKSYDEPWTSPTTETQSHPTSWHTQSTSVSEEDFLQRARSMGLSTELAHRVVSQQNSPGSSIIEEQQQEEKAKLATASEVTSPNLTSTQLQTAMLQKTSNTGRLQPTAPEKTDKNWKQCRRLVRVRCAWIKKWFLPCAHIMCCEECARTMEICPICRASIQSKIRSYFA
jgi:hypothetical protein